MCSDFAFVFGSYLIKNIRRPLARSNLISYEVSRPDTVSIEKILEARDHSNIFDGRSRMLVAPVVFFRIDGNDEVQVGQGHIFISLASRQCLLRSAKRISVIESYQKKVLKAIPTEALEEGLRAQSEQAIECRDICMMMGRFSVR